MIEAALLAWKAASWGLRIAAIVGPIVVGGIAYGVWHHKVYQGGVDDTIAKIARNDAKTVARASKLRDVYETCAARNGRWDQTTGACR
jgi:hypothetical protein